MFYIAAKGPGPRIYIAVRGPRLKFTFIMAATAFIMAVPVFIMAVPVFIMVSLCS